MLSLCFDAFVLHDFHHRVKVLRLPFFNGLKTVSRIRR